jgi:hypothetical protein
VSKLARNQLSGFSGSGPVRYRIVSVKEGIQSALLAVDYSEAPVPPHYYVADYFEVANLDPQVLFTFGKLNYPRTDQLRNKLEVDFPASLFVVQFWSSRDDFHKTLRAFAKQYDYQPVRQGAISGPVERVQTIHSNNALMVLSGGECMIDFFYISPRDMALKTPKAGEISLEPLVRIIASPSLVLGFLDACEPIAESLVPKYALKEDERATLES